jgi:hypothetical protein
VLSEFIFWLDCQSYRGRDYAVDPPASTILFLTVQVQAHTFFQRCGHISNPFHSFFFFGEGDGFNLLHFRSELTSPSLDNAFHLDLRPCGLFLASISMSRTFNCQVTISSNLLTEVLASIYKVTTGCNQVKFPDKTPFWKQPFLTDTGAIQIYHPLLINQDNKFVHFLREVLHISYCT